MSGASLKAVLATPAINPPGLIRSWQKLLEQVQEPGCSVQQLLETIESDPALAFRFMQLTGAETLSDWHKHLTPDVIQVITLTSSIEKSRSQVSPAEQSLCLKLWLQTVATAVACESIISNLAPDHNPDSYSP